VDEKKGQEEGVGSQASVACIRRESEGVWTHKGSLLTENRARGGEVVLKGGGKVKN